ncbi:hypothetical protein [Kribbella catacumbae]|uniref:hypothetical protein n=1 Tax=Kribbella catacumbae TaxID=460086 RepID=UPI000370C548|nr:hypothetical protein [Kribbella catacumbae]
MKKKSERLPRSKTELEALAEHYGTHDTGSEMAGGEWVEPPMVTTSLRLPKPLVDALKAEAGQQHIRHTALMRRVLAAHVAGEAVEQTEILDRLDRIERLLNEERQAG